MKCIILPRELATQARVALPIGTWVAISQPRILASRWAVSVRAPAMGKRIAVGMPDEFSWLGAAGEISALMCRITPGPIWIPIPGRALQFRVLAVGDWPANRFELGVHQ
jgi:hypothetical protein